MPESPSSDDRGDDRGTGNENVPWWRKPKNLLWCIWGLLGVIVVFTALKLAFPIKEWDWMWGVLGLMDIVQRWAAVLCLAIFFFFVYFAISSKAEEDVSDEEREGGKAAAEEGSFPSPGTKLVAFLLVVIIAVNLTGFFLALNPPFSVAEVDNEALLNEINEALITLFAAGIGSCIATIMAFTRHASWLKDFHRAWIPWYVARPVMAMLLGLVFYFLIRGGLLTLVGPASEDIESLNKWGLAGMGALVGLFSRNAIGKLREVFHTMFRTEGDSELRTAELGGGGAEDEPGSELNGADALIEALGGLSEEDLEKLWKLPKLEESQASDLFASGDGAALVLSLKTVEESEIAELSDDAKGALKPFLKQPEES